MKFFDAIFGNKSAKSAAFDDQLTIADWPAAIYAIGDIHGCLDELLALEAQILADATAPIGPKLIVTLGDYIDRGPNSAGVIDHLVRPLPDGFSRVALAGNHEEILLNALSGASDDAWLQLGGVETLRSYGIDPDLYRAARSQQKQILLQSHFPEHHLAFLNSLAVSLQVQQTVFVHAGIKRDRPMDRQDKTDLLWIRREFLDAEPTDGLMVIHGHTPVEQPELRPGRIGIDTGAYATGRLTAVRLIPNNAPFFFTTAV